MRFEDDPKVAAAKRWLQSRLEEAFNNTSFYCRSKFAEFQYDPVMTGEGDPVVRHAVREFRKSSLECIPEGFSRILEAIRTLQQDARDDLADIAKNLTWEAIDETFNWTAGDRSNPSRFKDWTTQAKANFEVDGGVVMVSPECNQLKPLAAQLNCDFRTQFECLLNQLRDEAFLDTHKVRLTNTAALAEPIAAGALRHDQERETQSDEGDLVSRNKKTRGIARARVVAKIKRELDVILPDMFSMNDFEKLAGDHPDFTVFQVCRGKKELLGPLQDLQSHKQYLWLAIKIAAARLGKKPATIATDWKRYKRFL